MKITLISHATLLMDINGLIILTDPWFFDPVYLFGRHTSPPSPSISGIDKVDIILISHDHADHADRKSLAALQKKFPAAVLIYPAYAHKSFRKYRFREKIELEWGDEINNRNVMIKACYGCHRVPENTYLIQDSGRRSVFFGADTLFFDGLGAIGEEYNIEIAFLPVSGTVSRGIGRETMDASDAVKAVKLLDPNRVIPIHFHFKYSIPALPDNLLVRTETNPEKFINLFKDNISKVQCTALSQGESILI